MRKTIIAGAVAALVSGGSALALTPAQIAADLAASPQTITVVNLTGSSAFRDELLVTLNNLCAAGTKDAYGSDASFADPSGTFRDSWNGAPGGFSYNGPDFRAYSCTLSAGPFAFAPALGASANTGLLGTDVLVYYRSEGGSVYGVAPLALSAQIQRLDIPNPAAVPAGEVQCVNGVAPLNTTRNGTTWAGGTKTGFTEWLCSVPAPLLNTTGKSGPASDSGGSGWWLPYDNWVNNATNKGTLAAYGDKVDLVLDIPTMGVADVEPAALSGTNYPANNLTGDGTSLGGGLSPTQLGTLTAVPVLQQLFGIIVSTKSGGLVTPTLTNLSTQTVSGILSGHYTNWNQTVEGGGTNALINVCRRDPGSGTQTVTSITYGGVWCANNSKVETLTTMKAGTGVHIFQYSTTGDVQNCVASTADSIGISVFGGNPAGGKFVSIDNVTMSQANLLNGTYKEWAEVNYVKGPQFTSASANQQALINGMIQATADATGGAVAASSAYAYIPNQADAQGTDNLPTLANVAKFVNLGSKKGFTCNRIVQPQNNN